MSIETTIEITREVAIERIATIVTLIRNCKWYPDLEEIIENEDSDLHLDIADTYNSFLDDFKEVCRKYNLFDITDISKIDQVKMALEKLPNKTLENFIDRVGVRFSMFENYNII